jgi:hypothetical protein
VTSVGTGAGLKGGPVTSSGSIEADFGATAGKIAEGNHTHGNLTNDGKIGSASGVVVTNSSGLVTTLPPGANGTVLTANSAVNGGVEFAAPTNPAHTHGITDSYVGFIEAADDKTYTIDRRVATARTITDIRFQSTAGTCTVDVFNGADKVGTVNVNDTNSGDSSPTLSDTAVSAGGVVGFEISSNSNAENVSFVITYTRVTGAIS